MELFDANGRRLTRAEVNDALRAMDLPVQVVLSFLDTDGNPTVEHTVDVPQESTRVVIWWSDTPGQAADVTRDTGVLYRTTLDRIGRMRYTTGVSSKFSLGNDRESEGQ